MAITLRVRQRSRAPAALVAIAVVAAALTAAPTPAPAGAPPEPPAKPNLVVIMTDDLSWAEMAYLPSVQQLLAAQGRTFEEYVVSVPVCCPSRVTMFRGQYAHNTGVFRNVGEDGGFAAAHAAGLEAGMLAPRLQSEGYATALYGRYLNGYPGPLPQTYVPPGWTDWGVAVRNPNSVLDYTLNENGTLVDYGTDESDYVTDVLFDHAVEFIEAQGPAQPFLVWLNPYAPHAPSVPAARHVGTFDGLTAPKPPSYNEADVSDKPAYIRAAAQFLGPRSALNDREFQDRVEALQAVDENVARLMDTLTATGHLDDTYVAFSSDNGFHLGHHRLLPGKGSPYEEDVRVPLIVRGPGVPAGSTSQALVGNVDLLPTMLALAHGTPAAEADGRDISGELRGTAPPGRQLYLLEHWQKDLTLLGNPDPDEETGVVELTPGGDASIPDFSGFRTRRWKYVRYSTGERELYDLAADPYELDNIVGVLPAPMLADVDALVDALATCVGSTCHALESQPAPLPTNLLVDTTTDLHDPLPGDGLCGSGAPGGCSLRAAITETNAVPGLGVVAIPPGIYPLARPGPNEDGSDTGDLDVTDDLAVFAAGATVLGDGTDRVLDVLHGQVAIQGLAVRGGAAPMGGARPGFGGGIAASDDAVVALIGVDVRDNAASQSGGGISARNGAVVAITDSTIAGNEAPSGGGISSVVATTTVTGSTIQGNAARNAGGMLAVGPMTIATTTIAENEATDGMAGGVLSRLEGPLHISDSVVRSNRAHKGAGGIAVTNRAPANTIERTAIIDNVAGASGGGIDTTDAALTITASTFAGNRATRGGGLHTGTGSASAPESLTLSDITVIDNEGAGLAFDGAGPTLGNSIIATQRSGAACAGPAFGASLGSNLDPDGTCQLGEPTDLTAAPLLGPRSGTGSTIGHVPLPTSPAVDSGAGCAALDQRHFARPYAGTCDRGALESGGVAPMGLGNLHNFLGTGRALPAPWRENASLAIGGPCTSKERGDRFSARSDGNFTSTPDGSGLFLSCVPGDPASVASSTEHDAAGYQFTVQVPPTFSGTDRLHLEAQGLASCVATDPLEPGQQAADVTVTVQRDDGTATPETLAGPMTVNEATDEGRWCGDPNDPARNGPDSTWHEVSVADVVAGERFVITIATTAPADLQREQAINRFALRARVGDTFVPCSADASEAEFDPRCPVLQSVDGHPLFLERGELGALLGLGPIGPEHDGGTLELEVWDPGDGLDWMELRDPTGRRVGFTYEVACQDGTFPGDTGLSCAGETPPSGGYGPTTVNRLQLGGAQALCESRPRPEVKGCWTFNDRLLRISVRLPDDSNAAFGGATVWQLYQRTVGVPAADVETWTVAVR